MSGRSLCLTLFLFSLLATTAAQTSEPSDSATVLLAGRVPWGAAALPSGEVLVPCEDRSVIVLDAKGTVLARWTAASRISAAVTVDGARSLVAVLQAAGRVDVLRWDPRTRVLASAFAAAHAGAALASAWGTNALYLAWKGGLQAWSPDGSLVWQAAVGEPRFLLVDENLGCYVFEPSSVTLFDFHGGKKQSWPLQGTPGGILQTTAGELFCWTEEGLFRKAYDADRFAPVAVGGTLLGVAADRLDGLVLTLTDRVRRLKPDGGEVSAFRLPHPAVAASAVDDRGRLLVPTTAGLEVWTYDGRLLAVLDGRTPACGPLITGTGLAVWGTADWNVRVWTGFRLPAFGWPQLGGGPYRSYSARRPESVAVRAANWADNTEFSYLFLLASSGEEAKQREVLERLEAQDAQGGLLARWPYANLLLLKIARSGLTDLVLERGRVTNDWPALRQRAYGLLSRTAAPDDREELLDLLRHEYDPLVVTQGVRALSHTAWDGDGKLLRLLAELRGKMSDQAPLAEAVLDGARTLWQANGQSTDPVLIPLVSAIYQGSYPRVLKQKAQTFFQDLMNGP